MLGVVIGLWVGGVLAGCDGYSDSESMSVGDCTRTGSVGVSVSDMLIGISARSVGVSFSEISSWSFGWWNVMRIR